MSAKGTQKPNNSVCPCNTLDLTQSTRSKYWVLCLILMHYKRKIEDLDINVKSREDTLADIQTYQDSSNMMARLSTQLKTLKSEYKYAQTKINQLKDKIDYLENGKSTFEERFKAQEERHKEDTQKNLIKALPKWKENLILHTQMVTCPFNLGKVDFGYLKCISMDSLNFDVYDPKDEEREAFLEE
ncbi:hypothetical protein J1N35_019006 [Gossypium stocksii]|uniref:Uncharacterized protein n=1 Tax=Gossypium stocksii TaxID=47602 RepID=A0A9D4A6P7_9ROSI|nr:hypothetical protein J1N35_019006 [Gossypium stocksii]